MKSIWALGIASITTLSILALWRCSMVVIPLKKWNMGHREAVVIIIVIWIYSLAVTLPPLFGWGRYGLEAAHIRYARCPKSEIRLLVFCTCHHSQNGRLRRDFNCYAERCCLIAKLNQLRKGCHGYKLIFVDDPLQSERGKDRNQASQQSADQLWRAEFPISDLFVEATIDHVIALKPNHKPLTFEAATTITTHHRQKG